jgi:ribose transport system permease protein
MLTRKEIGLLVLLVALCALTAIGNPQFLSTTNIQNMSRLVGIYGIFSIGVGIVVITGGIDLSVGSMFALLGVVLSILLAEWHWPVLLTVGIVLALGAALGAAHGLLVSRMRLQPFIVTLCGLLLYRGLARYIAADTTKGFGNAEGFIGLRDLATGSLAGLPNAFLAMLGVGVVAWVLLERSVYGRHLMAVGRNEVAARYAGVNATWVVTIAYVISGTLAGIAGIFLAFYTNSISPSSHGNFYELYAIAAAVLGGCSLRGGEGSVLGILIGTALLQVLRNLVVLLDIPGSLDFAVMGAVILIGVVLDQLLRTRQGSGRRGAGARARSQARTERSGP